MQISGERDWSCWRSDFWSGLIDLLLGCQHLPRLSYYILSAEVRVTEIWQLIWRDETIIRTKVSIHGVCHLVVGRRQRSELNDEWKMGKWSFFMFHNNINQFLSLCYFHLSVCLCDPYLRLFVYCTCWIVTQTVFWHLTVMKNKTVATNFLFFFWKTNCRAQRQNVTDWKHQLALPTAY